MSHEEVRIELNEWVEDITQRDIGSRLITLCTPPEWGTTHLLGQVADHAHALDVSIVEVRVPLGDQATEAGVQLSEVDRGAFERALRSGLGEMQDVPWLRKLHKHLDIATPWGIAGYALGAVTVPGGIAGAALTSAIFGGARALASSRSADAGLDDVRSLAQNLAFHAADNPLVVVIDEAQNAAPDLVKEFASQILQTRGTQILLIIATTRPGQAKQLTAIDFSDYQFVSTNQSPRMMIIEETNGTEIADRITRIDELFPQWDAGLKDTIADRTANYADLHRIANIDFVINNDLPPTDAEAAEAILDQLLQIRMTPLTDCQKIVGLCGAVLEERLAAICSRFDREYNLDGLDRNGQVLRVDSPRLRQRLRISLPSAFGYSERQPIIAASFPTHAELSELSPLEVIDATTPAWRYFDEVYDADVLFKRYAALVAVGAHCQASEVAEELMTNPLTPEPIANKIVLPEGLDDSTALADAAGLVRKLASRSQTDIDEIAAVLDGLSQGALYSPATDALLDSLASRLIVRGYFKQATTALSLRTGPPSDVTDALTASASAGNLWVFQAATLHRQLSAVDTFGPEHLGTLSALVQAAQQTNNSDLEGWAFECTLDTQLRVLGKDHPNTLKTRYNIARWTGDKGDKDGALTQFQQLLPDRQRVLGNDHPNTLNTRHNIASCTGEKGDIDGALTQFQQLLPDRQRVLSDDHPDTLNTRNDIARWTGEKGDIDDALTLFQQLLHDRQRVLSDDHPDTLTTRNNIASWTGEKGDIDDALTRFQQLLPDRQRVLSDDHPNTLTTRNDIARWTGEKGDIDDALTLFQQLLHDQTRVLGKDHPHTLTTRYNIAHWTGEKGDIDDALTLFQQLLHDHTRVLGKDHPHTLKTRHNIAHWTGEKGDIDDALTLFQQLLPDRQRVLGKDHPDTLATRHSMAYWTGQKGDIDGALTLSQQLLPDRQRVLGKDHPNTLRTRTRIATWTGHKGDIDEALTLLQQLLPDQTRVLGKDHPDTLRTRNNIARWTKKLA